MKKIGKPESPASLNISKEYLRENEELYHSLFENSMDAILLTGPDGLVFSANPAACKMFGWSEEEICRLGRNGLVDNSDPRLKTGLLLRERTGSVFGELTMIRKSGERFPVEISSNIFRDPSGNERTSMIIRDISERKQIVEALKESEFRFQQIAINSVNWIWEVDQTGLYTYSSPVVEELLGYKPEEIINKKYFYDLFKPEDREQLKNAAFSVFAKRGTFRDFININVNKNGMEVILSTSGLPVIDSSGNLTGYRGMDIDISARKKLEQEMQQVSIYTRNLIEASIDSLVTVSVDGKITDVNFATEKITGIKRKKLIGSHFTEYFTEPDKARKGFDAVLKKGVIKDYPLTIFHKSGRQTDVLYNATLFTNEAGEVQGIFAAARDITIRKNIEEELRKSKELMVKLNRRLNEIRENERALISREVHDELGQSMTALKLDLNQMYKYVSNNQEAVKRLDNMIGLISNTIKVVQRISSDLRPGILDDLGLVTAIEWYCDEFENRTGIKCSLELDNSDLSNSEINLTFFRVLQECLTNVTRHSRATSVNVDLNNSRKGTTLTIHDNGIGISKEKIDSYNSLGLINIRERVRQFNGKVTIRSKQGVGTKLTAFIPS